ncbi:AAA family ATPase [Mycetocola zhujimingii]|uniref:AAA family ATPase n=1 Tax=Mycetocola zhujimingii TaxID=2079792 RepID=UPI000D332245|nr:AAA family ATPase [Mycetocola zhujimingii]AWB86159.1 hypothetical protein C3E77_05720 [Mycetocola zhujimingii]
MKLRSLEVSNFRSIRGTVQCDLDASVILVHGANGAGKTSIMSAIELGLTGSVSMLEGFGGQFGQHLLHSGAASGAVSLSVEEGGIKRGRIELSADARSGKALLGASHRDFLRERAYLAQSTMARLLETYEQSDRRGDSALARFVNELLGLETLDALIAGLEPSRDIRRVRKLVPEFADLEAELKFLAKRAKETRAEVSRVERAHGVLSEQVKIAGGERLDDVPSLGPTTALLERVSILTSQFESLQGAESVDFLNFEAQLHATNSRINGWQATSQAACQNLLKEVLKFANVQLDLSAEPGTADKSLDIAENLIADLLAGAGAQMSAERAARSRLAVLDEQIDTAEQGVSETNAEIAAFALRSDVGALAEALSTIAAHLDDDACPVCGRDFGEMHVGSLSAHLAARISQLGTLAKRVATLGERRTKQQSRLDDLVREKRQILDRLQSGEALQSLASTIRFGNDLLARIAGARPGAVGVARELAERQRLESSLSASRAAADGLNRLRGELSAIGFDAGVGLRRDPGLSFREQLDEILKRVEGLHRAADAQLTAFNERNNLAQALEDRAREMSDLHEVRSSIESRIVVAQAQLDAAKDRVDSAVRLSKSAVELRTRIVEQVFDSTLNGTWRDLFTRLAPEEPYIPEFVTSDGPRSGVSLRAVNKRTKMAGPPGLVLSAGNLNTAALTLFLSLNATAKSSVELLLLDDPVQAMDDVHVAQFSALLRSFAHDLGRQVVIAVHERSLFEYLSLELAPASVGESLVTIELSRAPGQETDLQVSRIEYRPDPIEAGLSAA